MGVIAGQLGYTGLRVFRYTSQGLTTGAGRPSFAPCDESNDDDDCYDARRGFVFLEVLPVSRSTTVVPIRLKTALAERVKATAAYTGRSTNRYIADLLAAVLGDERRA